MLYLLILLIPLSASALLWRKSFQNSTPTTLYTHMSNVLFALLGAALACWAYDLTTTFYAIDIAQVAYEVNPLGWPLGALGALSYYGPTIALTYVLLGKIKQKISILAAVPMTVVALMMGSMNFLAGVGNFQFFLQTAYIAPALRMDLLALVGAADLTYLAILATMWAKPLLGGFKRLGALRKK